MIAMTCIVVKVAPIGIFCLVTRTFGILGFETVFHLAKFIGCVLLGLAIQMIIVYPILLYAFTKLNPFRF